MNPPRARKRGDRAEKEGTGEGNRRQEGNSGQPTEGLPLYCCSVCHQLALGKHPFVKEKFGLELEPI